MNPTNPILTTMTQGYNKLVKWLRLLVVIVITALLLTLYLLTLARSPSASAAPLFNPARLEAAGSPIHTAVTLDGQYEGMDNQYDPTTRLHSSGPGVTDTLTGPRFWDTPLQSGASALLNNQQVVIPGPDDQVRLIVQLHDAPVAVYTRQTFGGLSRLSATEVKVVQSYAAKLVASQRELLAQIKRQDIQIKVNGEFGYLFNGIALSTNMRHWQRLAQLPQVRAVYPDYEVQAVLGDSVPLIGAPQVWQLRDANGQVVTGQGIRVAIIDTGIDYTHPDLGGCFGPACRVIGGYDFVNNDNDPLDDNGHGTHVAGIVAANGGVTGVAPGANLLAYKVLDAYGNGFSSAIIVALERAANPDGNPATNDAAHVINLSLSGPGDPNDPLSQAVDNAVNQDIVVAVGAGNSGPFYETVGSPGVARKALTVVASDKSDQSASFSSRGPVLGFLDVLKPDIAAPGVSIFSTVPTSGQLGSPDRYRSLSGTSMATPHIAGAAALLKQLHPAWTPEMIKANLMNTTRDLGLSLYEQGAGRVQAAKAAIAPLVAMPGSLAFGLPHFDGTTSAQLTLINVSTATVTAGASISTILWANGGLTPLPTPVLVTYAQLSHNSFTLAPGATAVVTVSLNIPSNALEGYYTGKVILQGAGYTLTVPFAFTLLSKVTVHILDEHGAELSSSDSSFVHLVKVPEIDIQKQSYNQVPATFYIPAGTYHVHGYGRLFNYYDQVFQPGGIQQKPLILATSLTVAPNTTHDVYLNAAIARRFTLDATTFAGDPLFIPHWRTGSRYQNGDKQYTTQLWSFDMSGYKNTDLRAPLPTSLDFYISDTPNQVSFTFASEGYGYSPPYLHFRDLNSSRWYESPTDSAGFNLTRWADEVYLFGWQYPKIDASTPTTFSYSQGQVGRYKLKYDFPGTLDDPWWGFISGGDALFYLPTDLVASLNPLSAGLERNLYVRGAFAYRYWANNISNNLITEREFYTQDWTKARPPADFPDLLQNSGWDLQPLRVENETIRFGVGPLYPALTFDNLASSIRLIYPLLGSSRGNKVSWSGVPSLTIYRNGVFFDSINLSEYWSSPSLLRQISAAGPGNYRLLITADHNTQVSYNNTIEAGFTLPAADMNPPRVTALEMPQRFAPGQPISATLTVADAESGVSGVQMRYSTDAGASWTPLPVTQEGPRYTAVMNPGSASTISLAFTVTDKAGNYLTFTTLGAAIRETPVVLNLELSSVMIPLSSAPFTIHLSGTLRQSSNEPLSEAALPIAIYLNEQLAGYVRDVARLSNGTFQYGAINFDWTFIPTDFIDSHGPAQLKFVFDMGSYARQEQVFTMAVEGGRSVYLPIVLKN